VENGTDVLQVARSISSWGDVSVFTSDEERMLLLEGSVDRARRQIGLFRILLVVVSAVIMSLIIYTLTLDKVHDIALLKLMGARNRVIVGLILQQALLLGFIGYGIAVYLGSLAYPHFPRRVILTDGDYLRLGLVVFAISVVSSLLGIWKAMRVDPQKVI
jgi:putative ABC transport system permease protein